MFVALRLGRVDADRVWSRLLLSVCPWLSPASAQLSPRSAFPPSRLLLGLCALDDHLLVHALNLSFRATVSSNPRNAPIALIPPARSLSAQVRAALPFHHALPTLNIHPPITRIFKPSLRRDLPCRTPFIRLPRLPPALFAALRDRLLGACPLCKRSYLHRPSSRTPSNTHISPQTTPP